MDSFKGVHSRLCKAAHEENQTAGAALIPVSGRWSILVGNEESVPANRVKLGTSVPCSWSSCCAIVLFDSAESGRIHRLPRCPFPAYAPP